MQMYPRAPLPDGLRDVVKRAWRLTLCLDGHVRVRPQGFRDDRPAILGSANWKAGAQCDRVKLEEEIISWLFVTLLR